MVETRRLNAAQVVKERFADEPEQRYRWFVGYFVTEMVELDYVVADLVGAVLGDDNGEAAISAWGDTGSSLARRVRKATDNAEVQRLVSQYEDLYAERNRLVHGLYSGMFVGNGGAPEHHVIKLLRHRKADTLEQPFRYEFVGFGEEKLELLARQAAALVSTGLGILGLHRKETPHGHA